MAARTPANRPARWGADGRSGGLVEDAGLDRSDAQTKEPSEAEGSQAGRDAGKVKRDYGVQAS